MIIDLKLPQWASLLKCPFCGGEAELVADGDGVYAGCAAKQCLIKPITASQVPYDSPSFVVAYNAAVEWVNRDIELVMPSLYEVAVYNLGASFLVNYGTESVLAEFRKEYGLNDFRAGVITGAGDNSTSAQRLVPDFFKDLSLADLQMLQDPWGRRYLMIAQQFGSLWGLS